MTTTMRVIDKTFSLSDFKGQLHKARARTDEPSVMTTINGLLRSRKRIPVIFIIDGNFTTCLIPLPKGGVLTGVSKRNCTTDAVNDVIGYKVAFHRAIRSGAVTLS